MGHHFTTPALSCKEQNSQEDEMPVSFDNFTNDYRKMPFAAPLSKAVL